MIQTYLITVLFFFTPYAEKAVAATAFSASFKRIQKSDGTGRVNFHRGFFAFCALDDLRSESIRLKDGVFV